MEEYGKINVIPFGKEKKNAEIEGHWQGSCEQGIRDSE